MPANCVPFTQERAQRLRHWNINAQEEYLRMKRLLNNRRTKQFITGLSGIKLKQSLFHWIRFKLFTGTDIAAGGLEFVHQLGRDSLTSTRP